MIRLAVIGTNFITDRFLKALALCPDLTLAAVYSRTLERAREYGESHGASFFYDSLDALAESRKVDAVYIASPNAFHAPQAIRMLQGKKHVLCEKPIASNEAELRAMIGCAEENGAVLLEAMRPIFHPGFQAIREALPRLGTVRRATFTYCQYSSRYDKFKNGVIENAFQPELSNSALMDIGCYCVHPLVRLFGAPESVTAMGIKLSNGFDGAGTIVARYPEMLAEILYSKITNSISPSEIQGERGSLRIEGVNLPKKVTLVHNDGFLEPLPFDYDEQDMAYEAREFVRLIGSPGEARGYLQTSLMEIKLIDEARKQMGIEFPADRRLHC